MSDLHTKTLIEIRDLLTSGDVTARQVVDVCLARIQATEPGVDALITVLEDEARNNADAMDAAGYDASKPLWGVPLIVKDALTTKGVRTTCASKILDNFIPFYDAEAVARLKDAGAIIIAKANLDEFAMGSTTENSSAKTTKNPWDTDRVPGGSSGGSAAAVASSQCFGALGTDTGGSIRQPASLCGCVGLKPTYGRVSRYGLVAYGSSLDQIGPMARSVEDVAAMLQVIAGNDDKDSTCAAEPVDDYLGALAARTDLSGLKIGLPEEYWGEGADPEVVKVLEATIDKARELGAETVRISLPHTKYAIAAYYIVAMAEASSNLARFDGVRYGVRDTEPDELVDMYVRSRSAGFGDEVQRRIMIGTYVLSAGYYDAYYRKAAQVRALIKKDFDEAFAKCDLLAGPVSPVTAWPMGTMENDPLKMYLMDIFTISLNLAGLPGISIPAGLAEQSGMPVGLQLMGPAFGEAQMLAAANVLFKAAGAPLEPTGL